MQIKEAAQLHINGQLDEAEKLYKSILLSNPKEFDALQLLGAIYVQKSKHHEATKLLHSALKINRNQPFVYNNLGVAYRNLNELSKALYFLKKAISINSEYIDAIKNLGYVYADLGEYQSALDCFNKLFEKNNNDPNVIYDLAVIEQNLKNYSKAIDLYKISLEKNPKNVHALNNLGVVHNLIEENDLAVKFLTDAIEIDKRFAQAYCNRSGIYVELEKYNDALIDAENALLLQDNYIKAINHKGLALHGLKRYSDAISTFEHGIRLNPKFPDIHCNKGYSLQMLGLMYVGEALICFKKALTLNPYYVNAKWNTALLSLSLGNYTEGFDLYEARWKHVKLFKTLGIRRSNLNDEDRLNKKNNITGSTVYVHCEQGLGDTIQFSRYIKKLKEYGANVIFEVQESLIPLLSSSGLNVKLITKRDNLPDFDYHIPLLSLPYFFDTTLESIPAEIPYINTDIKRFNKWKSILGHNGFKIGICWQGSTGAVDNGRSFPLKYFFKISELANVRLISLHKGVGESQINELPSGMRVEFFGDSLDSDGAFLDTAAIIKSCDLVITSDTAVAHLAGAMGARVWVLLKDLPDWRWLLFRPDTPWYNSMILYRQVTQGDWTSVFDKVYNDLKEIL